MDVRRWGTSLEILTRGLATGIVVFTTGLLLTACETITGAVEEPAAAVPELAAVVADLARTAELTPARKEALQAAAKRYTDRSNDPGTLWYLAADLHVQLTAEELEALFREAEALRERRREQRADRREGEGPGRRPGLHGPHRAGEAAFARGLDRSEDQERAMRALREKYRAQMQPLLVARRDRTLTEEQTRELKTLREALHEEMQAVLTAAQRAKREALREQHAERREEMAVRREAVHAAMVDALGLTPEQQAQLRELRPQPAGEGRRRPGLRPHTEGRDELRAARASILSEEQREIVALHRILSHRLWREPLRARRGAGAPGQG